MSIWDIARLRLSNQRISQAKFEQPGEVVAWLGAMQAQDFPSAKWAMGLRCSGETDASIERAIAERAVLRTWLLRGTLHLVAPVDIHWMRSLLAPRLIASRARRDRELELDQATYSHSFKVLVDLLEGGSQRTRKELMSSLEQAGISTNGQRGYHILARAALEGLICFGPHQGKEQTFILLDEWVQPRRQMEEEEALAELARRYFFSHGPATLADFNWWSGLAAREARTGLEIIMPELQQILVGGQTFWLRQDDTISQDPSSIAYLLPGFDEYYLGYSDRSAILHNRYEKRAVSSNGVFRPFLVIGGQVVGTWKREIKKRAVAITLQPFEPMLESERNMLAAATIPYGAFLGLPVKLA